jgi:glycosyltransferase involved in cell wall biosynthesis
VFVAVGRLVEKKAPQLTIEAFAKVLAVHPTARLRFIGTGPLREQCEELAKLRCGRAVEFLGEQPHDAVVRELQTARAFVQHSVVAPDGDMEGMPVSVIEAGASGLPVVSTRHSGIADIVVDGVTGFLVEEGGVDAMAARMAELVERPALAGALGRAARRRVEMHFGIDASIDRLRRILEHAAGGEGA